MGVVFGIQRAGRSNYILASNGQPFYFEQQVAHICCVPICPNRYYLMTPEWKNGKKAGNCEWVACICSFPPLCCLQRIFGCIPSADEYHEKLFRRLTGKRLAREKKTKPASPPVEGVTPNPLQTERLETGSGKGIDNGIK